MFQKINMFIRGVNYFEFDRGLFHVPEKFSGSDGNCLK